MRASFFVSAAVAIFSAFAVASPVAAPAPELAIRDTTSVAIIGHLNSCKSELAICHTKWTDTCSGSCSTTEIINWQKECATIIVKWTSNIKGAIPSGYKCADTSIITVIVQLVAEILVAINVALAFLLGKCGLLGGLLAVVLTLVLTLVGDLKIAVNALLALLAIVIDGLLSLVANVLLTLLGGATCYCCSLFGF